MRACLRLLLLFALTTGAAYLASRVLVPNAVPGADSERPQWHLQLAFVLRSIELIGLGGMVLVLTGCPGIRPQKMRWRAIPNASHSS